MYTDLTDHHRWVLPEDLADRAGHHGDRLFVSLVTRRDVGQTR